MAPRAISKHDASVPAPPLPFIIVPGSILNVTPLVTIVLPCNIQFTSGVNVVFSEITKGRKFLGVSVTSSEYSDLLHERNSKIINNIQENHAIG